MDELKNILIVIADDWSPIAGCYGNDVVQTPNIDRLAREGVVFDHAYCGSPSCGVSRASLLTGLHSHRHGMFGHCHEPHGFQTREWVRSIPVVLGDHGYRTGIIGKKHFEPDHLYRFDFDATEERDSVNVLCERTEHFLNECQDKPFFAMVATGQPHRVLPGYGNDKFSEQFPVFSYGVDDVIVPDFLPDVMAVREDLADYYVAISRYDHVVGQVLDVLTASGRSDETLVLVMTDHGMPYPGAKGSSFDTGHRCPLIVRMPGQCGEVREHDRSARREEKNRMGNRSQAMVSWVDVAPTVYEWCGLQKDDWPESVDGRSFLPVITSAGGPDINASVDADSPDSPGEQISEGWDETWFSHCFHEITNYFPYRVLRGRRYKYVRNLAYHMPMPMPSDLARSKTWRAVQREGLTNMGKRPTARVLHHDREALFDMEEDPMETTNRIDDPALASVIESMRAKMMRWRIETKDPWLEVSVQEGEPGVPSLELIRS